MSETQRVPTPKRVLQTNVKLPSHSRPQMAAAVLTLLDDETLQQLCGRLSEKNRDRLFEAIRSLRKVEVPEQIVIAKNFEAALEKSRNAVRPNDSVVERLSLTLFPEPEPEPIEEAEPEPEEEPEPEVVQIEPSVLWQKVTSLPIPALVKFFSGKSSSVLSVAISCMPDDVASNMIGELDQEAVKAAMVHAAINGTPNPVAVEAVEQLIEIELFSTDTAITADTDETSNAGRVANYLNRMVSSRRDAILSALENELDEDTISSIKDKVLSFGALKDRLPRSAVPNILRVVDEKALLTALKYAMKKDGEVVDYMMANISQRMAVQYREKMDEMSDIEEEVGEKAQSGLICKILELADEGTIELVLAE